MKVSPELGNVINVITKGKEDQTTRKALDAQSRENIEDIISVENKQASRSRVENVEEAKEILSYVTRDMESVSSRLYNLNEQRISRIIS
jgi:hypothetical protein